MPQLAQRIAWTLDAFEKALHISLILRALIIYNTCTAVTNRCFFKTNRCTSESLQTVAPNHFNSTHHTSNINEILREDSLRTIAFERVSCVSSLATYMCVGCVYTAVREFLYLVIREQLSTVCFVDWFNDSLLT